MEGIGRVEKIFGAYSTYNNLGFVERKKQKSYWYDRRRYWEKSREIVSDPCFFGYGSAIVLHGRFRKLIDILTDLKIIMYMGLHPFGAYT